MPNLNLRVDVIHHSDQVDLVGVLGLEHGLRGTVQAGSFKDNLVVDV